MYVSATTFVRNKVVISYMNQIVPQHAGPYDQHVAMIIYIRTS